LPLTISASYLTFCFVVVGAVELAAIVVEVEVEIKVVMEEGVVLRRGSLVLAPSEEKSTVVLVPPFGTNFTPTVWRPPRGRTHDDEKISPIFQFLHLVDVPKQHKKTLDPSVNATEPRTLLHFCCHDYFYFCLFLCIVRWLELKTKYQHERRYLRNRRRPTLRSYDDVGSWHRACAAPVMRPR
jgi:hypothetical protein